MIFSGFIFPSHVSFNKTVFQANAWFNNATFSEEADFSDTTFSIGAYFSNVIFSGIALFDNVKYGVETKFDNAIFTSITMFSNTTFSGNANFAKTTFAGFTHFDSATFSRDALFTNATFSRSALYENTTFRGDVKFNQSLFEGYTSFQGTTFEKKSSFIAIKGQSFFSLSGTKFLFVPDFNQAHFTEAPQFDDSDFSKALKNAQTNDKNNLSSRWRSLKRLAIQGHDHDHELLFFSEEIISKRGIQDKAFPNIENFLNNKPVWPGGTRFWLGVIYECSSDFGRSVMRPILLVIILGFFSYLFYREYPIEDKPTHDDPIAQVTIPCERSEAAIYLSVQSALPFLPATRYSENINRSYECLYGKANIPNAIVFISIIQTILSTILIFLSLLALRNHFKIK